MNFFTSRFETIRQYLETQKIFGSEWRNLFSWQFWTETHFQTEKPYFLVSLLATIVMLVALWIWRQRIKKAHQVAPVYDRALNHLANIIAFIIIIGLSYLFFVAQDISYLSSRLVILISLILVLAWVGWVAYFQRRIAPALARNYLEQERFFRYIPKKKSQSNSNKKKK